MDQKTARNGLEMDRSVSDKHLELLRSSARYISTSERFCGDGRTCNRGCGPGKGQVHPDERSRRLPTRALRQAASMLWLWDWMVFISFRICIPSTLVLCDNALFWKSLPQGSEGASRTSSLSNCCTSFHCGVGHSSLFFLLAAATLLLRFRGHVDNTAEEMGKTYSPKAVPQKFEIR